MQGIIPNFDRCPPGYALLEAVGEDATHILARCRRESDGLRVVLKLSVSRDPSPRIIRTLENEYRLADRLDARWAIKPLGLERFPEGLALVLEDFDGIPLDSLRTPLETEKFLTIAVNIASAIAHMHDQGFTHSDINPKTLLVNPKTDEVRVTGFGLASLKTHEPQPVQSSNFIQSNLAFISPEQTGRMNRIVDYRTDFYSLGVTFYWLLTGKLPHEALDDLGMMHWHLAGTAVAPHMLDPMIPEVVSRIVMKLMAKHPEDRYHSGYGLKADAERCLRMLRDEGSVRNFELGLEDFTGRLQMPRRLYGREKESALLLEAFGRAIAGGRELLLLAGYAGVGKTALVHELCNPVMEARGYFLEGKFDQQQRNVPYSGFAMAFQGFLNRLLQDSEAEVAKWRQDILNALGGLARVLTDVIPNLELVIGRQPDLPDLGGIEAQNRFNYLFLELVKSIATRDHPLLVFLDDLQWIDPASLGLLKVLLGNSGVSNILVIGAYRENEVDNSHQLTKGVESLRKDNVSIEQLTLGNLSEKALNELIADVMHNGQAQTSSLANLILSKTGGNAFFTLRMLGTLAARRAVSFDVKHRCWLWDIETLERIAISDNVVSLLLEEIRTLDTETQRILFLAACVGFRFNLSILGVIAAQSEAVVFEHLQPALRGGLVVPLNDCYQFAHDRVQQTAYSLVPDAERRKAHLEIGRLLVQHLPKPYQAEQFFSILDHLNLGAGLLATPDERLELARLGLQASLKAKEMAAIQVALQYLKSAQELLPEDCWQSQYSLTYELHRTGAELEYLNGNFASSDAIISKALEHVTSDIEKGEIYNLRILLNTMSSNYESAIKAGREALTLLGAALPDCEPEFVNPNETAIFRNL